MNSSKDLRLVCSLFSAVVVRSATVTVTSTNDSGATTLRAALASATTAA